MRSGRSSRRRDAGGRWTALCIVAAVALLALTAAGTPASSFSTAHADRTSSLAVASDSTAALGLDDGFTMRTGETCRLAGVGNNLDVAVTVTVSLRDDSTAYGNVTLGDGPGGDEVTFDLSPGAKEHVRLAVVDESSYDGADVFYRVTATAPALRAVAPDRRSTIDDGAETADCTTTA